MNPADSQLLIVDASGARHPRLHVQFKEQLGFGHVSSHDDLEESKRDCAQFAGPTLVILFLGASGGQLFNYARFYQRGATKPVEVAILADPRVGDGVRRELLKLGVAEMIWNTDEMEAINVARNLVNDPRRFLGPVDPRGSSDNLFNFLPPRGGQPAGRGESVPISRASSRTSYESGAPSPSRQTYETTERRREAAPSRAQVQTPSAPSFENETLPPPPFQAQQSAAVPVFTGLETSEPPLPRGGRKAAGPSKGLLMAIAMGVVGLVAGLAGAFLSRGGGGEDSPAGATPTPLMTPIPSATPTSSVRGNFDPFANIPSQPVPIPTVAPTDRIVIPTSNVVTVATIRQSKSSWLGRTATVEGVVTMGEGGFVPFRNQFHLQDETGGILLDDDKKRGGGSPATGQRVRVTGQVDEFKGMLQLKVAERVVVLGAGQVTPRPSTPFEFNEALEGMLVRVENTTIAQGRIPDNVLHTNMWVSTPDGTRVRVYLDPDVKIFGFALPPRFSVQGILYQWAPAEAPTAFEWVIYPRAPGDFVF